MRASAWSALRWHTPHGHATARSHLGPSARPRPPRAMAQYNEHVVLIGGVHRDTRSRDLWKAIEDAGLRPSVLGCPYDMLVQGFSYVVFQVREEAIAAAALSGILQLHGRVLTLMLQVDRRSQSQAPRLDDSSDEERPPRPPLPPPADAVGPADAAGAPVQPAVIPLAADLGVALGPILQPLTDARHALRVRRVHHLRFHEEYYGVYLQIAQNSTLYEGHVSLLHCLGCEQRLTREQVRRIEARCRTLQARAVMLADVPMTLVMRSGRLHRGFCTVHVQSALCRELWGIRSMLSAWIPEAASGENRKDFHLSFDRVAEA